MSVLVIAEHDNKTLKPATLHAVVDPKVSQASVEKVLALGASVEVADEADDTGGYLLARLRRVHELCERWHEAVWTNHYEHPANPFGKPHH